MNDPATIMAAASAGVLGISITSAAGLKAWDGWLDVKRLELGVGRPDVRSSSSIGTRFEVADLKERVRKLEAIASGVDI